MLNCRICGSSPTVAKGLCNKHYMRLKRNGSATKSKFEHSLNKPGTQEHFWENVEFVDGPLITPCLIWKRATTEAGYGLIGTRPVTYSHRFSFENNVQKISGGMFVCHECDNPACCNPLHLFEGTADDNNQDMISKGRAWFSVGKEEKC